MNAIRVVLRWVGVGVARWVALGDVVEVGVAGVVAVVAGFVAVMVALGCCLPRVAVAATAVTAPAPAPAAVDAARAMEIVRGNACLGCHAVDRKLVGPSFLQIAGKYKGDAGAEAKLVRKVKDGGAGVWGMLPMPPHPNMSDADIRTVVDWVLAGAPAAGSGAAK